MARRSNEELVSRLVELAANELSAGRIPQMRELAQRASVSPSIINHYFSSGASLLSQAWKYVVLKYVEEDFAHLDALGKADDWDGVARFIVEVFSPARHDSRLLHLRGIAEALSDEEVKAAVIEAQRKTHESWIVFLEKYRDNAVIDAKVDLGSIALLFAAVPLGVSASKLEITPDERARMAQTWMTIIEKTLKP